ncbi:MULTISPECIES: hypothetical protein [unclassified Pseudomonas]|uniref:hypothetical protein n=1 Tax=unclassified Pseudomonas TaxID=196821 RepID=UPI000A1E1683|nr:MULTISPECIES: hypothetical protein [unclassified Pseudomonas]
MNTKTKASSYKDVADEAAFQLDCDREFADWMFTLMTAINNDHRHSSGANSAALSRLGVYLSESHLADTERALENVSNNLIALGGEQ